MNELFQERRKELFILIGLILILLITVYFLFIHPKYSEVAAKKSQNLTTETEINQLESQIQKLKKADKREDTFRIQKKIPETDDMDKLLLKLEEIEGKSKIRIEKIEFSYDDRKEVLKKSEEEAPIIKEDDEDAKEKGEDSDDESAEANDETNDEEIDVDDEANADEQESDQKTEDEQEAKLKAIEIEMVVNSPNYLSFNTFVTEFEKLERIVFVSELEFIKPAEYELYFEEVYDGTVAHKIKFQTFTYTDEVK